ncbi:MAG: DUF3883 domain-containing protein [Terracidiphilus sp.]|nr:DUF3883 domain-containing protein [Terracidiphilus sp.]
MFQEPEPKEARRLEGDVISYKTKARYHDCKLLEDSDSERFFPIPNRREEEGGYGQSPNWYGLGDKFLDKVWKFVRDWKSNQSKDRPAKRTAPARNNDPAVKLLVEQAAIRVATEFYSSQAGGKREVRSVERENLGWDLEAIGPNDTLKVEVKGVSASTPVVELTPNEFAKMNAHSGSWVLFIVTDCLSRKPQSFEIRYMHDWKRWEAGNGEVLSIQQKVAAVASLLPARAPETQ